MRENNHLSRKASFFNARKVNFDGILVGYSALIDTLHLEVPLPDILSIIGTKHKRYVEKEWAFYSPRYMPEDTFFGHLVFALKYEGIDLAVLKQIFLALPEETVKEIVLREPTGQYCRRIWFLYEWLLNKQLNIPDAKVGNFVNAIDEKLQYGAYVHRSSRHRINNNLPGTPDFCPLIRRTEKLESFIKSNLSDKARNLLDPIPKDILLRASAFLLMSDSRSSFAIEGETPSENRARNWGQAIGEAGRYPLTKEEILKLQKILIPDARFTKLGWRTENGFIGSHNRVTGEPIPDHISARYEDIEGLMNGIIDLNNSLLESDFDPVLHAALISFGFVFVHPLLDGNGRLHRYLIHHILAERKFTPKLIVFPVASVMLEQIELYKSILEAYSRPRLRLINWEPTEKGNVDIRNQTVDLYRYFDATQQAEFLYDCILSTIEEALPRETAYLEKYDRMKTFLGGHFDMPESKISLLIRFLEQNKGMLSKRAINNEFALLKDSEIADIESKFKIIFG